MVCHARLVVSSVGRPLEPSRRCRATSASLPSPPLLFLLLRRSFDAFRRCTLMTELFQTVADIRMNEDLVLRRRDKNPRRSRGKIASRLHRAGYTHDKTHRATRIMRENERIRGGGEGGGEERGRRRKVTGTRRAWRNFSRFRGSIIRDSRLVAHDRNIAESQRDRDTRRHAQFGGNRNAFTHRLKCDYTGRLATTRDSRGTNHHRLLTCGPPATPATSVRSRGNERWTSR